MIKMSSKGSFKNTYKLLRFLNLRGYTNNIEDYAKMGVEALAAATPVDTGKTAASWRYEIKSNKDNLTITWINDNKTKTGIPVVVLLYFGHGTPGGHYVQGRDFITPAIRPIFKDIADGIWKEVSNA